MHRTLLTVFVLSLGTVTAKELEEPIFQITVEDVLTTHGLVAFWDFQEPAGAPRLSRGPTPLALQEQKGPIARVEGGVFGHYAAKIERGQWFMVARTDIGPLDLHGKEAQVTVVAWILRDDPARWQAIAGVWDETRKKRQYCLFLNAARGTRADEMKRYPLANRIHGHVSAIGGPTPGDDFCITYSSGATEIPMEGWQCIAMSYDGEASRLYVNGKLDSLEHYNPFPYPDGLFDGGEDGADFTGGAVHRGGEWVNFFGGRIGGLALFSRALHEEEMEEIAGRKEQAAAEGGRGDILHLCTSFRVPLELSSYFICRMKTNRDLPDDIFEKVKVQAVERGTTVEAIIVDALQLWLRTPTPDEVKQRREKVKRLLESMQATNTEPMKLMTREEIYER